MNLTASQKLLPSVRHKGATAPGGRVRFALALCVELASRDSPGYWGGIYSRPVNIFENLNGKYNTRYTRDGIKRARGAHQTGKAEEGE
jgi:hypothetical protein